MTEERQAKVAVLGATGLRHESREARVECFPWNRLNNLKNLADYDIVILDLLSMTGQSLQDVRHSRSVPASRRRSETLHPSSPPTASGQSKKRIGRVSRSGQRVLHCCCGLVAHAGHNVTVSVERYRDGGVRRSSWTNLGWTPLLSRSVVHVCRRSCKRMWGRSAFSSSGAHERYLRFRGLIGVPASVVNTWPRSS